MVNFISRNITLYDSLSLENIVHIYMYIYCYLPPFNVRDFIKLYFPEYLSYLKSSYRKCTILLLLISGVENQNIKNICLFLGYSHLNCLIIDNFEISEREGVASLLLLLLKFMVIGI